MNGYVLTPSVLQAGQGRSTEHPSPGSLGGRGVGLALIWPAVWVSSSCSLEIVLGRA